MYFSHFWSQADKVAYHKNQSQTTILSIFFSLSGRNWYTTWKSLASWLPPNDITHTVKDGKHFPSTAETMTSGKAASTIESIVQI